MQRPGEACAVTHCSPCSPTAPLPSPSQCPLPILCQSASSSRGALHQPIAPGPVPTTLSPQQPSVLILHRCKGTCRHWGGMKSWLGPGGDQAQNVVSELGGVGTHLADVHPLGTNTSGQLGTHLPELIRQVWAAQHQPCGCRRWNGKAQLEEKQ